jgi:hypothetical protein
VDIGKADYVRSVNLLSFHGSPKEIEMNFQRSLCASAFAFVVFAAPACMSGQQQAITPEGTMTNSRQAAGPPTPLATIPPVQSGKSPEVLREEHAALIADTDKLAALVAELKTELLATNGMTLSLNAVKKAAEIEKLSHSMKKRLKS